MLAHNNVLVFNSGPTVYISLTSLIEIIWGEKKLCLHFGQPYHHWQHSHNKQLFIHKITTCLFQLGRRAPPACGTARLWRPGFCGDGQGWSHRWAGPPAEPPPPPGSSPQTASPAGQTASSVTHKQPPRLHWNFAACRPVRGTCQGFLVVVGLGVDANHHPHFPLAVKVVFEQVGHFGVSVGNHLQERTTD